MTAAPAVNRCASNFSRAAVLLYAVAQLFIAVVTVSEGRFGADARAHVEAAGTSAHHAHDEAGCAACAARGLLSTDARTDRPVVASQDAAVVVVSQTDSHPRVASLASARPRAPPVRQA